MKTRVPPEATCRCGRWKQTYDELCDECRCHENTVTQHTQHLLQFGLDDMIREALQNDTPATPEWRDVARALIDAKLALLGAVERRRLARWPGTK